MPYGVVVMMLFIVFRIKRTLDGAEIDKIIWECEASSAGAARSAARASWRPSGFEPNALTPMSQPLPRSEPDRM
ncbi:hypothetical protein FXV83_07720 [Bradyrhizobium hipponense]|uniref:Uncharacterized protein n=1 Tax=Bradyrhizobium hipponense TaxID=2605638 RepID=A0A5S4YTT4_9BRAD|nr:hypothetical protein [Bradyrhizobium hipponense]TYO67084.1 hypothetical protein FXV83_07720 [Bradyrhizobium hipponense]